MLKKAKTIRVAMLASTHSTKDARIYRREARALAENGYSVTIALLSNEPLPDPEEGINWILFKKPSNRFLRIAVAIKFLFISADIFHLHDIELAHLIPIFRILGKRVIFDVHEFFPEGIRAKKWVPKPLKGLVGLCVAIWERCFLSFANQIIVVTSYIGNKFPKHRVVRNFPIYRNQDISDDIRKKSIIYVGVMYPERLVSNMIEVGRYVKDMGFEVEIYGPAHNLDIDELKKRAAQYSNVTFQPEKISYDITRQKFNEAMFGLCLFDDSPRMTRSFPNKVFEYIAHGAIPIITPIKSILDFLEDGQHAIVVEGGDPKIIAERIESLADTDTLRKKGREILKNRFNWDIEKEKLLDVYKQLL